MKRCRGVKGHQDLGVWSYWGWSQGWDGEGQGRRLLQVCYGDGVTLVQSLFASKCNPDGGNGLFTQRDLNSLM